VPVEVAEIERGAIESRRVFTGTLEAAAQFVVAAKVGGRIERIDLDLADAVTRGQVVAQLEDAEYRQAVAQARAELAVARAQGAANNKALEIARRAYARVSDLHDRGITSEQELDEVMAEKLRAEAQTEIATAQMQRARAALREAEIRQDYTRVTADWPEGDEERIVAARHADEGETVATNAPLLTIVDLDPVNVIVYVTEKDYAALAERQAVSLTTDAYPGETFDGEVARVAPVFRSESRQARVELRVSNPDRRLKPGMFVRAETVLARVEDATIVPEDALVTRDGQHVVFVVSDDGRTVTARPVEVGVREGGRVQVSGDQVTGRVVTLGQQQLEDGTDVTIPPDSPGAT
jgi:RND family efflux transporter MFP subunit